MSDYPEEGYGFTRDGIFVMNPSVLKFINSLDTEYATDIFGNGDLKRVNCKYTSSGVLNMCQTWFGTSGAGVFDTDNRLMAIISRGKPIIGGEHHMGSESIDPENWDKAINLQQRPIKKAKKTAKEIWHDIKGK